MNVVLIIIDTLRQDHVGCYGNRWVKTPYLDSLAKESVLFTHAYPGSLPTLQVRRVLQTGCRIFPFLDHKAYKGNLFVGSPGWGPFVMVRDKRRWYNAYLWGESPLLYDLEADPKLKKNIAQEYPHICQRMKDLAIADAGGKVPEFLRKLKGEPGCTPLLVE